MLNEDFPLQTGKHFLSGRVGRKYREVTDIPPLFVIGFFSIKLPLKAGFTLVPMGFLKPRSMVNAPTILPSFRAGVATIIGFVTSHWT
ncbi:hypothetical protein AWC35_05315 [Gibbsiella quercinecans]|uniref:Uncharacterized protein n=1 Tax=Gibbsiella quercinecans TaxID=929813 RepID=A0A250AY70_9GAMM|nr:hypothetical protein AWC35_05315 [Gibbsiella quercinecans]RLM12025.1 hypothetical protein BIY31_03355 [Gibbsiella quercinecans]RLM15060.1 hypothetical protein BIY30_01075 [Gibbsiella quercinecans]